MAAKTAWSLPPTTDPLGEIVVTIERDAVHPRGTWTATGWTASARVGNQTYHAHSYVGPVFKLARHLAAVGVPDAAMIARSWSGETRHASFYALAGIAAAPAPSPAASRRR